MPSKPTINQKQSNNMKNYGFQFDNSYLKLSEEFFTRIDPTPASTPNLVILNEELAQALNLDFSALSAQQKAELFSGNTHPEGAQM